MIKGFETQTTLNHYELNDIVPLLVKGLKHKLGKENIITSTVMIDGLKKRGIKIDGAKLRKCINYIRMHKLVKNLIATSEGYYISVDKKEIEDYQTSLTQRALSIIALANSYNDDKEEEGFVP